MKQEKPHETTVSQGNITQSNAHLLVGHIYSTRWYFASSLYLLKASILLRAKAAINSAASCVPIIDELMHKS